MNMKFPEVEWKKKIDKLVKVMLKVKKGRDSLKYFNVFVPSYCGSPLVEKSTLVLKKAQHSRNTKMSNRRRALDCMTLESYSAISVELYNSVETSLALWSCSRGSYLVLSLYAICWKIYPSFIHSWRLH